MYGAPSHEKIRSMEQAIAELQAQVRQLREQVDVLARETIVSNRALCALGGHSWVRDATIQGADGSRKARLFCPRCGARKREDEQVDPK